MKKILALITCIALLQLTGNAMDPVAQGKTFCCLGNYVIEKADYQMIIDGNAIKTFVVSYENSDMTITIGLDDSNKKCTSYIVQSDDLTIQYDCNRKHFGVNRVSEKYIKEGFETDDSSLNRTEYFRQKVITSKKKSNIDQVKLISVFFPKLVTDYETVFAVK